MRHSKASEPARTFRRKAQRGTAFVEMALTLSVFLTLFIGMLDIAQVMFIHETLSDRVRAATRAGAVYGYDDTTLQNIIIYGRTTPAHHSFYGVTARNIQIVRSAASAAVPSLTIRVTGVQYRMMTPLFSRSLRVMQIGSTIPLETAH